MSNIFLGLLKSNHAVSIGCLFLTARWPALSRSFASKFYEDREIDPGLDILQIRRKSRHECSRRSANIFDKRSSGAGRRCDSPRSREVRHIRRTVIELPANSNVLAGHVIERPRRIPSVELVPCVFGKVRRARGRGRAIDRRQQHQIASGIVDFAATQGQPIAVVVEPEAVVQHKSKKTLLRALGRITIAAHASTVFASNIASQRESRLAEEILWPVEVFDFDAVVAVVTDTARVTKCFLAQRVLIT